MPILLGNVVLLVVSLIVMAILSPALTLIALAMVPLLLITGLKMRKAVFPATWDAQQRAGEVAGVVDETVTGVRIVKGFGQERRELRHLAAASEDLYRSRTRLVGIQALYTPTLSSIPVVGQVAVLAVGGWLAMNGHISLGTFLAFSSYLLQMISPVRMVATAMAIAQQARAGAERLLDILDTPTNIVDAPDAVVAGPISKEIRFEDVHFHHDEGGRDVLDGFDLTVRAGETVAIVGASGSGKSTAAMLLPRFYDVSSGRITVDGVDVRQLELRSLRRQIAVAFEEVFLFSESVRDNIAYGRPDATDAEMVEVARAGPGRRVHPPAAGRLRHRGRRARPHAVGWAASAHRPGPGTADRPVGDDPRRRHLVDRRRDRGADPRHPAHGHRRRSPAGTHDDPHRPPPVDAAPRRPDRRPAARAGGRRRDLRGARGHQSPCSASCSSARPPWRSPARWRGASRAS